jgi:Calx-beta domain-containing protein
MTSKSPHPRVLAAALLALSATAAILIVGTTRSRAQALPTFTVIEPTDAPDAQLNGVCASTNQGLCTLRAAVQEAEFAGGGRIVLSAGLGDYRLTIPAGPEADPFLPCPAQPPGPSSCPTNRTGDLDIRTNVIVNGIGPADSVIDGANINRIFDVHAGGTLSLNNVTLQNGRADFDSATFHEHGGAIHNHGEVVLDRVAIINSSSTSPSHAWGGGGITNAGVTQLSNVTVARNTTDAQGGGIENRGTLRSLNATITENTAPPNKGGGIFFATAPNVQMITAVTIVALNRKGADCSGRQKIVSSGANIASDGTCRFLASKDRRRIKPYFDRNAFGPPLFYPLLPASYAVDRHYLCQYNDIRSVPRPQDGNGDGVARCDSGSYELEPGGPAALFIRAARIREGEDGAKKVRVAVWLSAPSEHTVTVRVTTRNGTARAGSDFVAKRAKLTFRPGQRRKRFAVAVIGDRTYERNEKFKVRLSAAKGAPIAVAGATVRIVSDD